MVYSNICYYVIKEKRVAGWHKRWTKEEETIIKDIYGTVDKCELLKKLPHRTWEAIKQRAEKLNISRYTNRKHETIESSLDILLQEGVLSYYWLGFLMADGHIEQNKRIVLVLSTKDYQHLKKYADFIICKNIKSDKNKCWVAAQDKKIISQLANSWKWFGNKTKNPPIINIKDNDLFLAFLIGFIDGDGYIGKQTLRNDSIISIKLHNSWINILQYFSDRLSIASNLKTTKAHINKNGYAWVAWTNSEVVKYLKLQAIRLDLPILSRKWDKIDLNHQSRRVKKLTGEI